MGRKGGGIFFPGKNDYGIIEVFHDMAFTFFLQPVLAGALEKEW